MKYVVVISSLPSPFRLTIATELGLYPVAWLTLACKPPPPRPREQRPCEPGSRSRSPGRLAEAKRRSQRRWLRGHQGWQQSGSETHRDRPRCSPTNGPGKQENLRPTEIGRDQQGRLKIRCPLRGRAGSSPAPGIREGRFARLAFAPPADDEVDLAAARNPPRRTWASARSRDPLRDPPRIAAADRSDAAVDARAHLVSRARRVSPLDVLHIAEPWRVKEHRHGVIAPRPPPGRVLPSPFRSPTAIELRSSRPIFELRDASFRHLC